MYIDNIRKAGNIVISSGIELLRYWDSYFQLLYNCCVLEDTLLEPPTLDGPDGTIDEYESRISEIKIATHQFKKWEAAGAEEDTLNAGSDILNCQLLSLHQIIWQADEIQIHETFNYSASFQERRELRVQQLSWDSLFPGLGKIFMKIMPWSFHLWRKQLAQEEQVGDPILLLWQLFKQYIRHGKRIICQWPSLQKAHLLK